MYVTPLTMAESERAQRQLRSDDANAFALQLLMRKHKMKMVENFSMQEKLMY